MNNSLYNLQNAALGGACRVSCAVDFPDCFRAAGHTKRGRVPPAFVPPGRSAKRRSFPVTLPLSVRSAPEGCPPGRLAQPAARSPPDPPRGGSAFCNPTVRYPSKTAQTKRSAPSYSVVSGRAEITGGSRNFRGNRAVGLRRFRGGGGGGNTFRCPAFLAGLLFCRNGSRCAD